MNIATKMNSLEYIEVYDHYKLLLQEKEKNDKNKAVIQSEIDEINNEIEILKADYKSNREMYIDEKRTSMYQELLFDYEEQILEKQNEVISLYAESDSLKKELEEIEKKYAFKDAYVGNLKGEINYYKRTLSTYLPSPLKRVSEVPLEEIDLGKVKTEFPFLAIKKDNAFIDNITGFGSFIKNSISNIFQFIGTLLASRFRIFFILVGAFAALYLITNMVFYMQFLESFSFLLVLLLVPVIYLIIAKPILALIQFNMMRPTFQLMQIIDCLETQKIIDIESAGKRDYEDHASSFDDDFAKIDQQYDREKEKLDKKDDNFFAQEALNKHIAEVEVLRNNIEYKKKSFIELDGNLKHITEKIAEVLPVLKENKDVVNSVMAYENSQKTFSEKIIVGGEVIDDIFEIEYINCKKYPILFLYNDENGKLLKTKYLDDILKLMLEKIVQTMDIRHLNQYIVDCVTGADTFLSKSMEILVKVCQTKKDFYDSFEKVNEKAKKIAQSDSQDIEIINEKKYKDNDPLDKMDIFQMIIPSSHRIIDFDFPSRFSNIAQNGAQYGFLPIFYVNKSDWNNYQSDSKNLDPKIKVWLKEIDQMTPDENVFFANISRKSIQKN